MSGTTGTSPVITTLAVDDANFRRALSDAANLLQGYVRTNESAARALTATAAQSDRAAGGFRDMSRYAGQAGFQLQDFAVQVQGGTSALTALSQQGSQFLGIFGTAGAVAGAALTVGILATQLLGVASSTDLAKAAAEGWAEQLKKLNELMETSAQRAARLRSEQIESGRLFAMQQMQQSQYEAEIQGQKALRLEGQLAGLERLNQRLLPDQRAQNASEIEALRLELMTARSRGDVATAGVQRARELMDQFRDQGLRGGGQDKPKPTEEGESRRRREPAMYGPDYSDFIRSRNQLWEQEDRANAVAEEMTRVAKGAGDLAAIGQEFSTVFNSAFDGLITKGGKFADVLERLGTGIARIIERQFITKPLEAAMTSFFGNGAAEGGSKLFSGATTAIGDWIAGAIGFRADGGPVMAGSPYIVGERGPELFVPDVAGSIVPNHAMGGGPVINIDARGADAGVEARLDALLARRMPAILAAAHANTVARVNRGGADALALGRRAR